MDRTIKVDLIKTTFYDKKEFIVKINNETVGVFDSEHSAKMLYDFIKENQCSSFSELIDSFESGIKYCPNCASDQLCEKTTFLSKEKWLCKKCETFF